MKLFAALKALLTMDGVALVQLQPDDVVLLEANGYLSDDDRAHLGKQVSRVWPHHRVAIVDRSVKLSVVRPTVVESMRRGKLPPPPPANSVIRKP